MIKVKVFLQYHIILPKKISRKLKLEKNRSLHLKIRMNNKTCHFVTSLHMSPYGTAQFVLRKEIRDKLNISVGNKIEISIIKNSPYSFKQIKKLIKNGKVDLTAILPQKTIMEKTFAYYLIKEGTEEWILIWLKKSTQFKIKRYVPVEAVGKMFGLMQAECTKKGRGKLDFSNMLIKEHLVFIECAKQFGIPKDLWKSSVQFNPNLNNSSRINIIREFSNITKISRSRIYSSENHRCGSYVFQTYSNYKVLFECFLGIMNNLREYLANNKLSNKETLLAKYFISKLMTGDGSANIQRCIRSDKKYIRLHVRIFSRNPKHREDYKNILKNIGVNSFIREKDECVEANVNWNSLRILYNMNAFDGHHKNWNKIRFALLNHAKTRNLQKLEELKTPQTISGIALMHNVTYQGAHYWLNKRCEEGYLTIINTRPIKYKINKNGFKALNLIDSAKNKHELSL